MAPVHPLRINDRIADPPQDEMLSKSIHRISTNSQQFKSTTSPAIYPHFIPNGYMQTHESTVGTDLTSCGEPPAYDGSKPLILFL